MIGRETQSAFQCLVFHLLNEMVNYFWKKQQQKLSLFRLFHRSWKHLFLFSTLKCTNHQQQQQLCSNYDQDVMVRGGIKALCKSAPLN